MTPQRSQPPRSSTMVQQHLAGILRAARLESARGRAAAAAAAADTPAPAWAASRARAHALSLRSRPRDALAPVLRTPPHIVHELGKRPLEQRGAAPRRPLDTRPAPPRAPARYASRSRRRARLRSTAPPSCRLTAKPTPPRLGTAARARRSSAAPRRPRCWKTAWNSAAAGGAASRPATEHRRGCRPTRTARRSAACAPSRGDA